MFVDAQSTSGAGLTISGSGADTITATNDWAAIVQSLTLTAQASLSFSSTAGDLIFTSNSLGGSVAATSGPVSITTVSNFIGSAPLAVIANSGVVSINSKTGSVQLLSNYKDSNFNNLISFTSGSTFSVSATNNLKIEGGGIAVSGAGLMTLTSTNDALGISAANDITVAAAGPVLVQAGTNLAITSGKYVSFIHHSHPMRLPHVVIVSLT